MEISKETYLKFRAADASYAQFFDKFHHSSPNLGFCSMMRTIYFWAPAIAVTRVLLMAATFAVAYVAWAIGSTNIIAGAVTIALVVGFVWLSYRLYKTTIAALGIKSYFASRETPLLFQWAKATHDKVCPLIPLQGFIEEEYAAREAAREEAS